MSDLGPRIVIAGTHSGVGKTSIATGLMAALTARGRRVGAAKVGPDFIDPSYHGLATGRPSRNLDPWMSGADVIGPLAGRAARGADLLVIEGVMGLFDGAADGTPSSTATVAQLLDAPVVLVVDASSMSQSVAALVHGFVTFDPSIRVAGIILNRVASLSHEAMLRAALASVAVPILGALHRDPTLGWRDRHLGLIPVVEQPTAIRASLDLLAAAIDRSVDLDAVVRIAEGAAPMAVDEAPTPARVGAVRVAVAAGPAFSFTYPDNLEALAAAGAELVPFDPCEAERLPERCGALVAGGGFPEVYGEALAANLPLLADVRARAGRDLVVWAECGGLLWLARKLDGHEMAGVIDGAATMTERRTLGYRSATTLTDSPLGPAGLALRGHEFHYSTIEPQGSALRLAGREGERGDGFATPRMLATYLHVHLGARPDLAEAFVRAALSSVPSASA